MHTRIPETERPWHAMPAEEVRTALATGPAGLSSEEAAVRLDRFGPNRLSTRPRRRLLRRFLAQFDSVVIYALLVAGIIAAGLGAAVDSAVIFGVVIINAVIGFLQENKAERALAAIRDLLAPQASVVRDGHRRVVAADTLVPGDLVVLNAGNRVPADLRIVSAHATAMEEAPLTGESLPVDKATEPVGTQTEIAERTSMAYAGTLMVQGRAHGIVVATGGRTELGRISALVGAVESIETPLTRQLERFGRQLTAVILALSGAVFLFGIVFHAQPWADMMMAAVGLAVAAIPEGLPAVVTITLALGVGRMAQRHAIVRWLPAVETLGCVNVICSDKTGTLTENELTVRYVATALADYEVATQRERKLFVRVLPPHDGKADEGLDEALRAALHCNEATIDLHAGALSHGSPIDRALVAAAALRLAIDGELAAAPCRDVVPFDSKAKLMAVQCALAPARSVVYLKGAPERIIYLCGQERAGDAVRPIDREAWLARAATLAAEGARVIAVASKQLHADASLRQSALGEDFVLAGLIGLVDPLRAEAADAVASCHAAGIRVKLVTGDHPETARAIANRLDLGKEVVVVTGPDIDRTGDKNLPNLAAETDVFARTTPEHKIRLVAALQQRGNVVAMTGDGVNDAAALKRADIGIAMGGKGTEAAKEASDMVLADDNFSTIAAAVAEGRTIYDNIRKSVLFVLPTNGGEALTVIAAIAFGAILPVTPAQILWINMVTAVTLALAFAFEPAEADVMHRPPRPVDAPLLSGFLLRRIVLVTLLMAIGVYALFIWQLRIGAPLEMARSVAVNALVAAEAVYVFNIRRPLTTLRGERTILGNPAAIVAVAVVAAAQIALTYIPVMQRLFKVAPLGLTEWSAIGLFALIVFAGVELDRIAHVRRRLRAAAAT